MRRTVLASLLALLATSAACDSPAEPESYSIVGTWVSAGPDSIDAQMTLTTTARAVQGAGGWLTPSRSMGFSVTGAQVSRQVSLLFDFDDMEDIAFQGEFQDTESDTLTILAGRLYGSGYRGQPMQWVRSVRDD